MGSRCGGFRAAEAGDRRKAEVSQTSRARSVDQNVVLAETADDGDMNRSYSLGKR